MKKSSLLKLIVVIGLSLLLAFRLVTVYAADDSSFPGWDDPTTTTSTTDNTVDNTTDNTPANATPNTTDTITTDTTNTTNTDYNSTINTGNATTDLNTSTNDAENEVENLAYTGIESNSIMTVVILVAAIVAGYSLKKVRDYNI